MSLKEDAPEIERILEQYSPSKRSCNFPGTGGNTGCLFYYMPPGQQLENALDAFLGSLKGSTSTVEVQIPKVFCKVTGVTIPPGSKCKISQDLFRRVVMDKYEK
ncbi:hypothetical protein M1271_07280 [Patescibacteria group bacterium]|nr:hypothetical protein [Patescibacteria group bacterium]